jgi:hypothetical protein
MAVLDEINYNGRKARIMNVSQAVGPNWGGHEDVILVKVLLEIVLVNMRWCEPGALSSSHVGTLDDKTKKNIKLFQQKFNDTSKAMNNPQRLSVDGRVSRARGEYSWDRNRPWTIVKLNETASFCVRMHGYKSAADAVAQFYPHLAKILKLESDDVS